ncbi:unnamed protein product, partial [marine sediment metagenome]
AGEGVIVVGGGLEGCETALWLVRQGKNVTIVEMVPQLVPDIYRGNRAMLLDLLEDSGVDIMTNMKVEEITDNSVIAVDKNSNMRSIDCDTVVLAVGLKPNKGLYNSLVGEFREIYEVGDCKEPRKIADAIEEATMLALNI